MKGNRNMTEFNWDLIDETEPQTKEKPPLVAQGFYKGIIIKATEETSKKGNPMIKAEVRITSDVQGNPTEFDKRELFTYFVPPYPGLFAKPITAILGITLEQLKKDKPSLEDLALDLTKAEVNVQVIHEDYENPETGVVTPKEKIKEIGAPASKDTKLAI